MMKTLPSILMILLLFLTANSWGQNKTSREAKQDWLEEMAKKSSRSSALADSLGLSLEKYALDSATTRHYLQALEKYYDYRIFGYQHRENVFKWQLFSSKVTFVVVLLLVLVGIFFSYLQFKKSFQAGEGKIAELMTNLEASPQGIKLSSPVLGVIILLISLLFFYLYLIYIYPIIETF
jgi:hypothetical protein